jgi:hypothetical protein
VNSNTQSPAHYTRTAIALHWALAAALLANFVLGVYMHELPFSMTRLKLYNWHKWAGILILAASALRLLWRLKHRPPADLPMPLLAGTRRPCCASGAVRALLRRAAVGLGLQLGSRLSGGGLRRAAAAGLCAGGPCAGRHLQRACTSSSR